MKRSRFASLAIRTATLRLSSQTRNRIEVSLARLLAHDESLASTSKTLVPVEFCQEMARQLRVEKISRRLYRLFPPESILTAPQFNHARSDTPLELPSAEIHGLHFRPQDPARQAKMRHADAMAVISEYAWE